MRTSLTKRMLALLLVVCMVILMAPTLTLPAKAATTTQDPVLVIAGSDFQAGSHTTSVSNVNSLLTRIKQAYPDNPAYGFLFAGDYTNSLSCDEDNYNSSVAGVQDLATAAAIYGCTAKQYFGV